MILLNKEIGMMTFKAGDKVRYKFQKTGEHFDKRNSGKTGVIESTSTDYAIVKWDGTNWAVQPYLYNLEFIELEYDPNQQGDREDDI
jgi:hypothetical protein